MVFYSEQAQYFWPMKSYTHSFGRGCRPSPWKMVMTIPPLYHMVVAENGDTPNHPFLERFSTRNHPAIGAPPWLWTHPYDFDQFSDRGAIVAVCVSLNLSLGKLGRRSKLWPTQYNWSGQVTNKAMYIWYNSLNPNHYSRVRSQWVRYNLHDWTNMKKTYFLYVVLSSFAPARISDTFNK